MGGNITDLLEFVSFTHEVRKVKRATWVKDEEQFENDSEHSFQLAIVSFYIIEDNKLALNPFRAMGLSLVHDLIEVHAGDTPAFGSKEQLLTKRRREQRARLKLEKQWPKFALLHELIKEYEENKTKESRFVFALDKLLPMLNNFLDNGRNWKREKISLEQVKSLKASKVKADPTVAMYYNSLLKLIEQRPDLFRKL